MKKLVRLVKSLDTSEVRHIQDFLNATKCKLRHKLLRGILTGKISNNIEAIRLIYPNNKRNAASGLSHLKTKLQSDILNQLLILAPDSDELQMDMPEIICEKYLLQSEILYARGLTTEAHELLNKTLELADKYDLPQINLSCCYLLLSKRDLTGLKKISQYFDRFLNRYKELVEAKSNYFSQHLPQFSSSFDNKQLTKVNIQSPGRRFTFWHRLNNIESLCDQFSFKEAYAEAMTLYDYVSTERIIRTDRHEAVLYRLIVRICIQLKMHQEALHFAMESWKRDSCERGFEHLYFAYLRSGCMDDADVLIDEVNSEKDLSGSMMNKSVLFRATIRFYRQDYQGLMNLLQTWRARDCKDFLWNLSPRLIELQAIFEMGDYDLYEYRFDCLRKKVERCCNSRIPARLSLMMQLFKSIIHSGFCLKSLINKEAESLEELRIQHWDPMGFEMVNIYEWLFSKTGEFNKTTIKVL